MYGSVKEYLKNTIQQIEQDGLFKAERIITTPQG